MQSIVKSFVTHLFLSGHKSGGTLIVSLDFELFWGMLDKCALADYQENVLGGRAAIPRMLELFQKYGIHATWAAVGFLFGEDYRQLSPFFPAEAQRPTYDNPKLNPYGVFSGIGEKRCDV